MKKIIICDDDESILEVVKIVLEEQGHEVTAVADPETIYSHIGSQCPDLILLDLWMPVLSGDTITRELKRRKRTKDIPVIIVSASRGTKEIAEKAGADDYLSKPFDIEELEHLVDKYV